MAHLLFAIPYRHLVFRAAAGVVAVFMLFAVLSGAVPFACFAIGGPLCPKSPTAAIEMPRIEAIGIPAIAPQPVVVKVAMAVVPTLSHNELIAQTFSALKIDLAPPVERNSGSLTARRVQTVAIRADGQPDVTPLALAEETRPTPLSPAVEAATAVADAGGAQSTGRIKIAGADALSAPIEPEAPAADPLPVTEKVAELPAAPVKVASKAPSGGAVVTGNGANARAKASKSAAVAFALPGGSRVTVIESSHGWLHVRDAKGRDGWIYKDYIDRS